LPPLLQLGPCHRLPPEHIHNMPTRIYLRLAEFLVAATLVIALLAAWRADRRDTAKLTADLATAKQSLTQADTRQHERDAQLQQILATLAAEKRTITTPIQILRNLPQQIPLPAPIALQSDSHSCGAPGFVECGGLAAALTTKPNHRQSTSGGEPSPTGPKSETPSQVAIPAEDLKPLYDFAIDCKACRAKLTATQADLTDERSKTAVLTHERDEAVRAAKGGSLLRRIARNAKWLAIGAIAGAVAATAHR
jgi:hypothetical protein